VCALFGIIGHYEVNQAQKAFDMLAHRGGDERVVMAMEQRFLGLHRLAITTITQPFATPTAFDETTILLNGEIYNYQQLGITLGMKSLSEIEVLHAAYAKWGDDFVRHLRGMFAIAIVEGLRVKLFRDPLGKKPLFYSLQKGQFIFASEMKAISPLTPLRFDKTILPTYLSFGAALYDKSFGTNIYQVEAGQCVLFDGTTETIEKKSHEVFLKPLSLMEDANEAEVLLEGTLLDAVRLRVPSEAPYACLLSGGLDSSLISAMATHFSSVHTFSIGYEGYEKYDERPYAKIVSEHIGSTHHEVVFSKEAFLQTVDEVVSLLDEPLADPAMFPLCYLMKAVRKEEFKVVLTGDGSDELFMGYRTYKEFDALEKLSTLNQKGWLEHYFKTHFSMHKEWEWHKRAFEGSMVFRSSAEVFTDLQQNRLLRQNIKENTSAKTLQPYRDAFESSGYTSSVDWHSYLDIKVMLGAVFLRKLDRMSMAHSIEARSPFLDKEVVDMAFSFAPELRAPTAPKALLKRIAARYLPEEIVNRKKKGFNYPYVEWLHESGELEVLGRVQAKLHLFREEELAMYLEKSKQGMFKQHLFSLYILCKWLEKKEI